MKKLFFLLLFVIMLSHAVVWGEETPAKTYLARVTVGDWDNFKEGFVDQNGTFIIEPRFDNLLDFSEGLAPAAINDQ